MPKILLNYKYEQAPGTTAYYIERAINTLPGFKLYKNWDSMTPCCDLYLNIEPCYRIIHIPGKKSCYWEIDNHINRGIITERYNLVDHVFIAQRYFEKLYAPDKTSWLPLAADKDIHRPYPDEKEEYDIGFIGNDSYPVRSAYLDQIGKKYHLLRAWVTPGEPYARALAKCKIIFNCAMDHDLNMRFFEAQSVGKLLLTDYCQGQDEVGKEGYDFVNFQDWPDLDNKIQYYLDNPIKRNAIGENARRNIMARNTYADRLYKIIEVMEL